MINKQKQAEAYLRIIEGLRMYWEAQADAARREQFYSRGVKPEPWHGSDEGPTFKKASDKPMDFPSGGETIPPPVGPHIIAEEAGPVDKFALEEVAKRIEERHADTGGGIIWDQGPASETEARRRAAQKVAKFAEAYGGRPGPIVIGEPTQEGIDYIKKLFKDKGYSVTSEERVQDSINLELTLGTPVVLKKGTIEWKAADEAQGKVRLARRMRTLSFAEFKELEELPQVCEIWAAKGMAKKIKRYAIGKGYELTAQVPRGGAKILEFTREREVKVGPLVEGWQMHHTAQDEALSIAAGEPDGASSLTQEEAGNFATVEELLEKYLTVHNYRREGYVKTCLEFAKLVRVLTIAEYKGDGCYEADAENINLKDFTL